MHFRRHIHMCMHVYTRTSTHHKCTFPHSHHVGALVDRLSHVPGEWDMMPEKKSVAEAEIFVQEARVTEPCIYVTPEPCVYATPSRTRDPTHIQNWTAPITTRIIRACKYTPLAVGGCNLSPVSAGGVEHALPTHHHQRHDHKIYCY